MIIKIQDGGCKINKIQDGGCVINKIQDGGCESLIKSKMVVVKD